jgi:hypothetical protein
MVNAEANEADMTSEARMMEFMACSFRYWPKPCRDAIGTLLM